MFLQSQVNSTRRPRRVCNKAELIGVNLVSEKAEEHLGVDSIFVNGADRRKRHDGVIRRRRIVEP